MARSARPRHRPRSRGSKTKAAAARRGRIALRTSAHATNSRRVGRDRGDHELHEHVEPRRADRRRSAGEESRRAAASAQAVGEDVARAGLESRHRLPAKAGLHSVSRCSSASTWSATAARRASATAVRCRDDVAETDRRQDLIVAAVLSGNRNFEGRIHPQVRANYLASPPLVVAYALAGLHGHRPHDGAARPETATDARSSSRTCGRRPPRSTRRSRRCISDRACSGTLRRRVSPATSAGRSITGAARASAIAWEPDRVREEAAVLRRDAQTQPAPLTDIRGARVLALLGDSVTTDHISPAGSSRRRRPAGEVPDRARRRAEGFQLVRRTAR